MSNTGNKTTEDTEAMRERNRISTRKSLKEKLLASRLAASRRDDLDESIRTIELEIDDLSNNHAVACEPLQAKVKDIDRQQIAQMEKKKSLPPEAEELRKKTVKQIQSLTAQLEAEVKEKQKLLAQVRTERTAAAYAAIDLDVVASLLETGRPDLLKEFYGLTALSSGIQIGMAAISRERFRGRSVSDAKPYKEIFQFLVGWSGKLPGLIEEAKEAVLME